MSTPCDLHPATSAIYTPREVLKAFGPTAVNLIPLEPEYSQLKNDSGDLVFLGRLSCGHFAMTSPSTVAAAETEIEEAMTAPTISGGAAARADLKRLNAAIRAGEKVDPADVLLARERITLEDLAEEGRQERLAAQLAAEQAAALQALGGPLRQEMAESLDALQEAQDAALTALLSLLDAVDEATAVRNRVTAVLINGGVDPAEVKPSPAGWNARTVVLGESFPYWQKCEYLIGILNVLKVHPAHKDAFYGGENRDLGKGIPGHLAKAPRPNVQ